MTIVNRLRERVTSARVRAVLSLGIVLGLGSVSTLAYWTDTGTMTTGSIQAGSLDLLLAGNLPGQGGTWNNAALGMSAMVPGESVAVTVPVQRAANTIAFKYTATATAAGDLAQYLTWTVTTGSAGSGSTSGTGIRTNTCGGTTLWSGTLSGTPSNVVATARTLSGATMSENLCIRAELPSTAPNAAQGDAATASFVFSATQLQWSATMLSPRIRRRLRETLLWVGAGLGVLCLVWTAVMFAFGLTPLVFTSGSMSPTIAAGDLAFARTIEANQIEVGDVVSVENAKGVRVTHRVVSVDPTDDGAVLSLQGDANATPDAEAYNVTSVERVWFSVPKAGYVVNAASSSWGMFAGGLVVAATLFLAFGRGSGRRVRGVTPIATGLPLAGTGVVAGAGAAIRGSRRPQRVLGVAAVALGFVGSLVAIQPTQATFTDTGTMTSGQLAAATIKPDLSCEVQGSPFGQKTATITWPVASGATTFTATATYAGTTTPLVVTGTGPTRSTTLSKSFLGNLFNQTYTVTIDAAGPGVWTATSTVPVTVSLLGLGMTCGTPS